MVLVPSCSSLLSPQFLSPGGSFSFLNLALILTRSLFRCPSSLGCRVRTALRLVPDPDEVLAELFRHGGRLLGHDRVFVQADNQCWKKTTIETLQIR